MRHFYCSIFSQEYAYKGLALYQSLEGVDQDFHFFLVCHDAEVAELYGKLQLEKATIITLAEIEAQDPQLAQVKGERNVREYIWSAKASTMLYILKHFPELDHIVWLDGDTFFYADPAPIFAQWEQYSIMLTLERWRKANRNRIYTKGRYNTGFMGFKRNGNALEALAWFRERLLEWCYDRLENGLWSDQLYINDWVQRFVNVGVIKHLGVNVGPYIIRGCTVTRKEGIHVNGQKLIFYHSYGFRYYDGNEYDLCSYIMSFSEEVLKWIYLPYIQVCRKAMARIEEVAPEFPTTRRVKDHFIRNYYNAEADSVGRNYCTVVSRDYLVQGLTMYKSLASGKGPFRLWVLSVDDEAYSVLEKLALPWVILISLTNVLNEKLIDIQAERQFHELCWTLKPYLVSYILKNNLGLDSLLYLDADLFFFRDPEEVFAEWGASPILLTRLWMGEKWSEKLGKYSAGFVGFRRQRDSLKVLNSWRNNCRDWCYDRVEPGRWGDQKYLDRWPQMLSTTKVTQHKGINTGPWNIRKGFAVVRSNGNLYFDGFPLVCYHFSGFKIIGRGEYELCNRKVLPSKATPIYAAYTQAVEDTLKMLAEAFPHYNPSNADSGGKYYNHHVLK